MNLISFSIWGNNDLYVKGISENLELSKEYYPGFKMKIFYDKTFNIDKISSSLQKEIIFEKIENSKGSWDGLFWRFYPAADEDVDILLVRDLDSRLNSRESAAVNDWLNNFNDFDFHGMRDNIHHNVAIMGGMWGCKNKILRNIKEKIDCFCKDFDNKGTDQLFLQNYIWEDVRKKAIVHDLFPNGTLLNKKNNEYIDFKDVHSYYAEDNCGILNDKNFPRGKITLKDGTEFQRLDIYEYKPQEYFNQHFIVPFPSHEKMKHGYYVGQDIK